MEEQKHIFSTKKEHSFIAKTVNDIFASEYGKHAAEYKKRFLQYYPERLQIKKGWTRYNTATDKGRKLIAFYHVSDIIKKRQILVNGIPAPIVSNYEKRQATIEAAEETNICYSVFLLPDNQRVFDAFDKTKDVFLQMLKNGQPVTPWQGCDQTLKKALF